jgi:3-deoxy-D-manno-octulosonate 8-phosphate phosphatase (KDO 8-P phosphatase)
MGNELLDIPLAEKVGLPIAVADASHDYLNCVAYITSSSGGHGAVREILECYFEATGKDPKSYII